MSPIEKDGICPHCGRRFTARAMTFPEIDDKARRLVDDHVLDKHADRL